MLGKSLMPPPPLMFNVPFVAKVSVPAKIPPVQPIVPLMEELVVPDSEPLSTVKEPRLLTVQGPLSVKVCPFIKKVCVVLPPVAPSVRPPTVGLTSSVTVYAAALVMTAVSLAPGTWLGLQLSAEFQLPPAVLVQVIWAARAEASDSTSAV